MKITVKVFSLVFLLSLTHQLTAQVLAPKRDNEDVSFSELNEKFVRNMRVLATFVSDPDAKKSMDAVIGQAEAMGRIAQSKGADSKRERILKRSDAMTQKETLSKADFIKMQKMRENLKEVDPANNFGSGRTQIMLTIEALQRNLGLIYAQDDLDKDVVRITRQHLNYYTAALLKLK